MAAARAAGCVNGDEPVNGHWKACQGAFERAFGKPRCAVFLRPLIPLHHEGRTLVLGAPSPFTRDYVRSRLSDRLARILEQPVRIEVSEIAKKAEARRRANAGPSCDI